MKSIKIVFIGGGNVAYHLAPALYSKGYDVLQIYSRTIESAELLAAKVKARATCSMSEITNDADLYIVSLRDDAMLALVEDIARGKEDTLIVHTSGSIPMSTWKGKSSRYGVAYPMQTFSKQKALDFSTIPFFLEANNEADLKLLENIFGSLSDKVYRADSDLRKKLHLSAVFACNFANHMYTIAADLLQKYDIPFDVLLALIDETTAKVHTVEPSKAQTGPAIRGDKVVMNRHLEMLSDMPEAQEIYREISNSIQNIKYKES